MSLFSIVLSIFFSFDIFALEPNPKQLLQEDLPSWYQKHTQFSVDEDFGITRIELYKNELLIGMATKQQGPIDRDGAMVASLDLKTLQLSKLAYLYEQGFYDMVVINDVLHIPGTDPRFNPKTDPEGEKGYPYFYWSLGNWYRIDLTQTPRKRELIRNLPFVVHGWGQWYDEQNQTIYHATSRVTCEVPAPMGDCFQRPGAQGGGALFKSMDFGSTWTLTDDRETGIGDFRTYDVQGTKDALFVVWSDAFADQTICGIARKKSGQNQWIRLQKVRVPCHFRLQELNGHLIAVDDNSGSGLIIDSKVTNVVSTYSGNKESLGYKTFALPDFLNFSNINPFKVSKNKKTVYFLGQGGVYFSDDLKTWNVLVGSQGFLDMEDIAIDETNQTVYLATRTQIFRLSTEHFRKVSR